jgi:hypothetical protein
VTTEENYLAFILAIVKEAETLLVGGRTQLGLDHVRTAKRHIEARIDDLDKDRYGTSDEGKE